MQWTSGHHSWRCSHKPESSSGLHSSLWLSACSQAWRLERGRGTSTLGLGWLGWAGWAGLGWAAAW